MSRQFTADNRSTSYLDFVHVTSVDAADAVEAFMEGEKGSFPTPGCDRNFPSKLHYALTSIELDGQSHIVGWLPHGRSFAVHQPKQFVDNILNCWFRQTKHSSFQRQLNIYGFKRITKGRDCGSYYHPLFLRGKPFLADHIPRQEIKGRGPHRPDHLFLEPNFYSMTFLPPTPKPVAADHDKEEGNKSGTPKDPHKASVPLIPSASFPTEEAQQMGAVPMISSATLPTEQSFLPSDLGLLYRPMAASVAPLRTSTKEPAADLYHAMVGAASEWSRSHTAHVSNAQPQAYHSTPVTALDVANNTTITAYVLAERRRHLEQEQLTLILQQPHHLTAIQRAIVTRGTIGTDAMNRNSEASDLLALLQSRHTGSAEESLLLGGGHEQLSEPAAAVPATLAGLLFGHRTI